MWKKKTKWNHSIRRNTFFLYTDCGTLSVGRRRIEFIIWTIWAIYFYNFWLSLIKLTVRLCGAINTFENKCWCLRQDNQTIRSTFLVRAASAGQHEARGYTLSVLQCKWFRFRTICIIVFHEANPDICFRPPDDNRIVPRTWFRKRQQNFANLSRNYFCHSIAGTLRQIRIFCCILHDRVLCAHEIVGVVNSSHTYIFSFVAFKFRSHSINNATRVWIYYKSQLYNLLLSAFWLIIFFFSLFLFAF